MMMLNRRYADRMGSIWIPDETILAFMQDNGGDREEAIREIQQVVEDHRPEGDDGG